jgi:hypothetical protein
MKRIATLLSIVGIMTFLMISCQKESDSSNAVLIIKTSASTTLKTAAVGTSTASKSAAGDFSEIVLETFFINIKDIELEFDESYNGSNVNHDSYDDDDDDFDDDFDDDKGVSDDDDDDDIYDDLEFEGPYLVDIMSPEVLNGMVLDSYSIPNATYDEIEFELSPYHRTDNDEMLGRSIYITGTINEIPFKLWTNKVKEIEIEFDDDRSINLTNENIRLYIEVSLEKVKSNLQAMNLSSAADRDGDGCIEIGNDDQDGNQALSGSLIYTIAGCFNLDDDEDDDDDDDDD